MPPNWNVAEGSLISIILFFFLYFFFLPDVFASFSVAREHKHEILKFKENWSLWWIGC